MTTSYTCFCCTYLVTSTARRQTRNEKKKRRLEIPIETPRFLG